jgi:hypothetical protein
VIFSPLLGIVTCWYMQFSVDGPEWPRTLDRGGAVEPAA